MAIPAGVMRFSLTGHLFGGEVFNTSFWFADVEGESEIPANNADAATALTVLTTGSAWTAMLGGLAALLRADCGYDAASLYCYPTGGPSATAQATKSIVTAGSSSLGTLPNQVCRVVTLNTNLSGRRNRGRVYLPATGLALATTTGLFSASPATLLGQIEDWITDQNATNSYIAVVVSTAGTDHNQIRQLKTDQRPDIQRRRAARETVGTIYTQAV